MDSVFRQDHRLSAEALLCLKGLRKNLKFVPVGFCLLVKVFLEFKNGLGFYLPCLDHEIPKTTEFFEECEPESVRIRVSLSIYTKGLGFEFFKERSPFGQ